MIHLRGITWNHPRGLAPLQATAAEFHRLRPDVAITWDVRSLKDFGDSPVEVLCEKFDLVMLDHPFIGTGVEKQVLIPLDQWVAPDFLADQAAQSVGPSYRSYTWNGHQWALAVDAAGQVAAYRPDLAEHLGVTVPQSWEQVLTLAADLPADCRVAMPLVPTDAVCSFISLCANIGGPQWWDHAAGIDLETGEAALGLMQRLLPALHPGSLRWNPPQTLDQMSSGDEIVYVPLLFGYSNYSRPGFATHVVQFANIPSHHPEPSGSILGGVGLGVSACSAHVEQAVEYAVFIAGGDSQAGRYFAAGGQPGHRSAWTDPQVNAQCNGFFAQTLRTLDLAYLRPRCPEYNRFQEQAGDMVHDFLVSGGSARSVVQALNRLYDRIVITRSG